MDTKRLVIGTIVGAVMMRLVGYLIFDVAAAGFYAADAVAGTFRDAYLEWAIALGNLSLAALVTLGIESRAGAPTLTTGLMTGAVIGFLVWFGVDFILYGITNVWGLASTIVDPFLSAINIGIAGAVVAAVLARIPKAAAA